MPSKRNGTAMPESKVIELPNICCKKEGTQKEKLVPGIMLEMRPFISSNIDVSIDKSIEIYFLNNNIKFGPTGDLIFNQNYI